MNRENNALIAQFMGVEKGKHTHFMVEPFSLESYATEDDLKYDISWDWLMPVIEKIESMKANFKVKSQWNEFTEKTYHQVVVNIEEGEMSKDRSCIYDSVRVYDYIGDSSTDKINAVYKAVLDFIKNNKL